MPTFNGVDVEHPDIVRGIRNLIRQKRDSKGQEYTDYRIATIVGMPVEVVAQHRRDEGKTWK